MIETYSQGHLLHIFAGSDSFGDKSEPDYIDDRSEPDDTGDSNEPSDTGDSNEPDTVVDRKEHSSFTEEQVYELATILLCPDCSIQND